MLAQLTWSELTGLAALIIGGFAVLGGFARAQLHVTTRAVCLSTEKLGEAVSVLQKWLERLDDRVLSVERETPLYYVGKDDWLRALNISEASQREILVQLAGLDEKVESQTRLAGPLTAQAEATTELARTIAGAAKQRAKSEGGP